MDEITHIFSKKNDFTIFGWMSIYLNEQMLYYLQFTNNFITCVKIANYTNLETSVTYEVGTPKLNHQISNVDSF